MYRWACYRPSDGTFTRVGAVRGETGALVRGLGTLFAIKAGRLANQGGRNGRPALARPARAVSGR
jgi:hypothetical protein